MNETVKTPQVLIVDDIPKNLQLLGQVLSKEGYKIIIASNGIQALKVTEKVIPSPKRTSFFIRLVSFSFLLFLTISGLS